MTSFRFYRYVPLLLCLMTGVHCLSPATAMAQETQQRILSGGISQTEWAHQPNAAHPNHQHGVTLYFTDRDNRRPIRNARIQIPDLNIDTKTNQSGRITVPLYAFKQQAKLNRPLIGNIAHPEFIPESFIIHKIPMRLGAVVEFSAPRHASIQNRRLVLDNTLHHLGDGDFSMRSSSALQLTLRPEGRTYTQTFQYTHDNDFPAILHLGAITGLDTLEAHHTEGSSSNTHGGPTVISFNGHSIGRIILNGQNKAFHIPPTAWNPSGQQTVQITAGINQAKADVDDLEFMTLWIEAP